MTAAVLRDEFQGDQNPQPVHVALFAKPPLMRLNHFARDIGILNAES